MHKNTSTQLNGIGYLGYIAYRLVRIIVVTEKAVRTYRM